MGPKSYTKATATDMVAFQAPPPPSLTIHPLFSLPVIICSSSQTVLGEPNNYYFFFLVSLPEILTIY